MPHPGQTFAARCKDWQSSTVRSVHHSGGDMHKVNARQFIEQSKKKLCAALFGMHFGMGAKKLYEFVAELLTPRTN
jgi:hypothetical protein